MTWKRLIFQWNKDSRNILLQQPCCALTSPPRGHRSFPNTRFLSLRITQLSPEPNQQSVGVNYLFLAIPSSEDWDMIWLFSGHLAHLGRSFLLHEWLELPP